jgi:hypothetical protein
MIPGMSPKKLVLCLLVCAACSNDVPPAKQPETEVAPAPPPSEEPHHDKAHSAKLYIESAPQGMGVLLSGPGMDKKAVGKTPVLVENLGAGNYDVTYKDEANGDVTMPVQLSDGEDRNVKYNVTPRADRPAPSNAKHERQ